MYITRFFRDADTYKYLKTILLPKLLKGKTPREPVRIWVPVCSTGEEAFSIAMTMLEIQDRKPAKIPVQIFATDLNTQAISKARVGLYSRKNIELISPKRIRRFFTKSDEGYRISKTVREMCVFAPHNILRDPPFSHLDFISCRNLFTYLDASAQKKAISTFHYALNDNGYLMLDKSEAIRSSAQLFKRSNKKFRLFSKKTKTGMRAIPVLSPPFPREHSQQEKQTDERKNTFIPFQKKLPVATPTLDTLGHAIDAVLVSEFMPASVVINHQMEILQFRGSTHTYFTHPSGKATLNILKITRPEIAFELRNAISTAIKTKHRVFKRGIEIKENRIMRIIGLEIVPLKIDWDEPLLLVLFTEQEQTAMIANNTKGTKNTSHLKDKKIKKLEEELTDAQADSLAFTQEQEVFIEELQSANEEVLSSNEELQTVNEELETSKEEIESANEELITTNQELQTRNDLLNESYDYSEAITATIHEAMIVLDKNLRVKSANKSFYKKFGVTAKETEGILLYDLGNKQWNIPRLREFLEDIVPKHFSFHDFEVTHNFPHIGEKIMLLNASRILQKKHGEELLLLSIQDITEIRMKTLKLQLKEKELHNKEIEQQKRQSELLEETVKQRTKDLIHANEELGKMNRELESFTYISSHDLQEPLRKIQILASRILEKESLSAAGKNYFHLMQNSAHRMQTLIQDLLAFSRLTTAERKFENTDLSVIIEQVKTELQEAIEEKQAVIEVKDICEVKIIPFQFRQLMENLISNALKFSNPDIPPHITIKSQDIQYSAMGNTNLPYAKEYCHISIADNGIGFKNEFGEKIFEVFQKLHSKDEYAGTGIGLAIVKKIVDNHKGIITATSELNTGTTFDIYIPSN